MNKGTALHAFLEHWNGRGVELHPWIEQDGYRFDFNCYVDLKIPPTREVELVKDYDGMTVTGHADGIWPERKLITDYKTTEKLDLEGYLDSFQWRFYLDMSGCDKFLYQVFVLKPFGGKGSRSYSVEEFTTCTEYRYPELHRDCLALVRDYRRTVVGFLEKLTN